MDFAGTTVQTRREFRAYISDVMHDSSERWKRTRKNRFGEGRVKSYLLDIHQPDDDSQTALPRLLRDALGDKGATVAETQDAGLFVLAAGDATFMLDAADPRFVIAHTTGHTSRTDKVIKTLVDADTAIDRAWLPSPFLAATAGDVGRIRRRTIYFDSVAFWTGRTSRPDELWDDADEGERLHESLPNGKQFSFDLRDHLMNAEAIDQLSGLPYFANAMSFSRVDVWRRIEGVDGYSVARIFNWGKISGVGTSGDTYLALVSNMQDTYRSSIRRIETDFTLGVSDAEQSSPRFRGHPLSITFSSAIPDLQLFTKRVFAGRRPFMLWGVPQQRGPAYITVQALDLHVQKLIYCELMPGGLRLYLKRGACANSIARLYTNLLTYYDAGARLWGKGEVNALLQ